MAIPGLGVGTGGVPVGVCASLMWTGYTLFNDHEFADFDAMRTAVREQVSGVFVHLEMRLRIQVPKG